MAPFSLDGSLAVRLAFVPMVLAAMFVQERLLPRRNLAALRVAQAAVVVAEVFVNIPSFSSTVVFAVICVPCTLLLFGGSLSKRLFVCALLMASATTAEVLGECLWSIFTGGAPTGSNAASLEHYPAHVASCLCGAVLLLALLFAMKPQVDRVDAQGGTLYGGFAAPILAQAVPLYFMGRGVMFASTGETGIYVAAAAVGVACLAGDVGLVWASAHLQEQYAARRRAKELEGRLEGLLDHYRSEAQAVEHGARLRHDLRNHLQAIAILAEQGRIEDAERYAADVADVWESAACMPRAAVDAFGEESSRGVGAERGERQGRR